MGKVSDAMPGSQAGSGREFEMSAGHPCPADDSAIWETGPRRTEILAIKKMVKKSELCERYSVSQRTVENWMNSGVLPYYKPSYGVVRFDIEACDKALERFQRNIIASDN